LRVTIPIPASGSSNFKVLKSIFLPFLLLHCCAGERKEEATESLRKSRRVSSIGATLKIGLTELSFLLSFYHTFFARKPPTSPFLGCGENGV
jgi:hypothetical protein